MGFSGFCGNSFLYEFVGFMFFFSRVLIFCLIRFFRVSFLIFFFKGIYYLRKWFYIVTGFCFTM